MWHGSVIRPAQLDKIVRGEDHSNSVKHAGGSFAAYRLRNTRSFADSTWCSVSRALQMMVEPKNEQTGCRRSFEISMPIFGSTRGNFGNGFRFPLSSP